MSLQLSLPLRSIGRFVLVLLLANVALVSRSVPVHAQDRITIESAAAMKAAFLVDLERMRNKFIGLAEAFPQDKYTWRPMDGVRSVSEVLMLIASEGYGFAPTAFGGQSALRRAESSELNAVDNEAQAVDHLNFREDSRQYGSAVIDKEEVIDHLTKGFAHALEEIEAIDPRTLVGTRTFYRRDRSTPELVIFVAADMHEHLGQLIAYARVNQIAPPWSR